eukprot:jgi/Mesvir1/24520/Mv21862-RA.1
MVGAQMPAVSAVAIDKLAFSYPGQSSKLLSEFTLNLPAGSRCLLIGANGAGKTTLLKIMSGKHLVHPDRVRIVGRPAFHDTSLVVDGSLGYLGGAWTKAVSCAGSDVPLTGDFSAGEMIWGVPGIDAVRRQYLVDLLDINVDWRMHKVSDGERRRVQICMGLLRPFKVLLLDEVTVDLDVVTRHELLRFLKEECEERNATVVYATHILEGLQWWATHLAYVTKGQVARFGAISELPELAEQPLYKAVERWLRDEKEEREAAGLGNPDAQPPPPPPINPTNMPSRQMAFYR